MNRMIIKKSLICLLSLILLVASIPLEGISFAATTVTSVKYNTVHNGFEIESGFIEIRGTELLGVDVTIEDLSGRPYEPSTRTIDTDALILIDLTKDETSDFNGQVYIDTIHIDLELETFPTVSSTNNKTINYGKTTPDDLVLTGTNLDQIRDDASDPSPAVIAKYGKIQKTSFYDDYAANTATELTILNPTPPGGSGGYQDLVFTRETTSGTTGISVIYQYDDAFRLVDVVGLTDPEMFPNMGAHGDTVYFTADDFNNTKNYNAYFLKDLAGGDDFNNMNRADFVALSLDIDGTTQDKLTVTVPSRVAGEDNFDIGTYYVVLVNEADDQVIAEQTVFKPKDLPTDPDVPDEYTIVESQFRPEIVSMNPEEGPDLGGLTTIIGSNILEIDLPGLTVANNIQSYSTAASNTELTAVYLDGTYGTTNEPVHVKRMFKVQIGKLATFDTSDYATGTVAKDHLPVTTGVITDAETDPVKDVQVEIITTIEEIASGKEYVFKQTATREDGYTFLPSTLIPEITEIIPETIQAIQSGSEYQLKEETLFTIKGSNFLVERVVENNVVITRKPTILFKKEKGNIDFNKYQLGFFPALSTAAPDDEIRFKYDEDDTATVLTHSGNPIQMEMTILDDDNKVVDGTDGNDVGTKIIIRIPNVSDQNPIGDIGIKQIQVVNPTRGSTSFGGITTLLDSFEFIETTDNPLIESVDPNIVTVSGGETVEIVGSNFQEGMKLYLDGEEITTFTRELDALGTKYVVTFTAPPGREGLTQIQVINPSGGMDVRDFSYVKSFNNDPEITNFTPTKGTSGTLVVVNGDNYLQPDTSVSDTDGVNGLRLIGTRALLDGVDVNDYNKDTDGNIEFQSYSSPDSDYPLLTYLSDSAIWSPFKNNATIIQTLPVPDADEALFYMGNDADGNPMITDRNDDTFFFTYEPITTTTGTYYAHRPATDDTEELTALLTITGPTGGSSPGETILSFTMDGTAYSFTGTLDNNILRTTLNEEGDTVPAISDYVNSVVFTRQILGDNFYYVLKKRIDGNLVFTNNSDLTYFITLDGSDFKANQENKADVDVTITPETGSDPTKLVIDGIEYTMITPYTRDLNNNRIKGDHTTVINANQLTFTVPLLTTGTGYKDLEIINPDTRNDSMEDDDGFYYITQSSSHPVISEITPNKGSTDGGYVIKITGSEFEDDMEVYIDSVLVPAADTYVSIEGDYVTVKVPACIKDLQGDFGIDELAVPVVVLNQDGGSDYMVDGFTYVVAVSDPRIDQIILEDGSANGGETVQILGYDFRYFEPYEDVNELEGYNYPDDTFTDLYRNGEWDDLLSDSVDPNAVWDVAFEHPLFDYYKESPILPTVFFGEKQAKIVEYKKGYIKVIAPEHDAGSVPIYVVNNDQGVSNVVVYTYTSSTPTITEVSPNKGNRTGQEYKDIYGTDFYRSELLGYADNDPDSIVTLTNLEANVRFGDIDNLEVAVGETNDGLINGGHAEVSLLGDLTAIYDADVDTLELQVIENGKVYKRTFNNYDDSAVYLPMEMLRNEVSAGTYEYYHPHGYDVDDLSIWNGKIYEYIKVSIEDRRLFVERGYAPDVEYVSGTRLTVISPSYYTIDPVPLTVTNNDGGQATVTFTYTNPDSEPKILEVNPYTSSVDGTYYQVQASIQGGIEIEVVGLDFRDDVVAYIGTKQAEIKEETTRVIDEVTYDVLILTVPAGTTADIDQRYPIVIENTDAGMANSTTLKDLVIPSGATSPTPYYFIYRKPLSGPTITSIDPTETSVFGGNTVVITGKDFRTNALVIIGTSGGVPITDGVISNEGTTLTITTPTGMSLGEKTVQVINEDFGTGSLANALTIVSFPTVSGEILTEDGESSMSVVSVEGGERIMVTGTGFATGARVFFGSTRTTYTEKPDGDLVGLFSDDSYIQLTDGYEATSVEFVDENTLIVTTPEITKEDTFNITVLNADGGISEDNADIEFSEPVPSRPANLKARVVDDRFIQLYDYTSDGMEYYEVYYYLGSKSTSEITKNDRQDMKYLGTTTLESYKINRIPGFENRRPNDVLFFALKAVNKFGVSEWSNFATLNYTQLEDVVDLGPEDIDGELGVPLGKDYVYDSDGSTSVINLSEKVSGREVTINLNGIEEGDPETRIINVPEELVTESQTLIFVDYIDSKLQFIPVGLNTAEFRELSFYDKAYGRVMTSTAGNAYNSMLKLSLPRGKKTATKIFTLDVEAMNNEDTVTVENFSASMDIQLAYDDTYLSEEEEAGLQMYRFDKVLNKWELMSATVDRDRNLVTVRTNKPGSFVVLYER
ncbi:MAG: IPT/TIG domain-containing protein [Clostridia bacterium]|nr:IPT/TIG domain-containing protein [Clostridia bacterium]